MESANPARNTGCAKPSGATSARRRAAADRHTAPSLPRPSESASSVRRSRLDYRRGRSAREHAYNCRAPNPPNRRRAGVNSESSQWAWQSGGRRPRSRGRGFRAAGGSATGASARRIVGPTFGRESELRVRREPVHPAPVSGSRAMPRCCRSCRAGFHGRAGNARLRHPGSRSSPVGDVAVPDRRLARSEALRPAAPATAPRRRLHRRQSWFAAALGSTGAGSSSGSAAPRQSPALVPRRRLFPGARLPATGSARRKIISGSVPSTNSGDSDRPQPRERSPPKPLSASQRNAAFTGSIHRSRAASSAKRHHRPQPAPAPKFEARRRVPLASRRSAGRPPHSSATPCGTDPAGPPAPGTRWRHRRVHWSSSSRLPARIDCTIASGTNRALFHRTRAACTPAKSAATRCAAAPRSRSHPGTESTS